MNNGWRYALHTLFFGVLGPLLPLIALLLGNAVQGTASRGPTLSDLTFMLMAVYAYGGVPALVTGGATAHAARRLAGVGLYGTAALAGFVSSPVWGVTLVAIMNRGQSLNVGTLFFPPLLLILGLSGALSALVCTWLARRLRPLLQGDAEATP